MDRPNFRDHVIQINQEVTYHIDKAFDAFLDGIEWVAPFMPWIVSIAIITSFAIIWRTA